MKPELMAFGGNWAINTRANANIIVSRGLGELSTSRDFVEGRLFKEESGTSMAAPHVAHLAASLLREHPDADPNMIRALLVAHASIPNASQGTFDDLESLRHVCGYGCVDAGALSRSLENEVTMIASARIANKRNHFYEIPIPDEFTSRGRRPRELSVALAYTPYVRSTRIAYKATRLDFRVVPAPDLEHVTTMFNKATDPEEYKRIPELDTNRDTSSTLRGGGTVQASTWRFTQFNRDAKLRSSRLFVVVTRNDHPWGEAHSATDEAYSLVVCLRDREKQEARLYTELRNRLQARARARARI